MNRQIWKFEVKPSTDPLAISAPHGAKPLAIGVQNGELMIWAEVSPTNPSALLYVCVIGTGWDYDRGRWEYISTTQDGDFVWHLLRDRAT